MDFDLTELDKTTNGHSLKPMSSKEFRKNIESMIKSRRLKMTIGEYMSSQLNHGHLPACRCQEILLGMSGD